MKKTNMCPCGRVKDARSKQCRHCYDDRVMVGPNRNMKHCSGCNEIKPIDAFRVRLTKRGERPRARCRKCEADASVWHRAAKPAAERNASTRSWEQKNPAMFRRQRVRRLFRMKGIEPTEELVQRVAQQKACDICGGKPTGRWSSLHIDHDHRTKRFRGLICDNCNLGLGKFRDDPELLQRASRYLKEGVK